MAQDEEKDGVQEEEFEEVEIGGTSYRLALSRSTQSGYIGVWNESCRGFSKSGALRKRRAKPWQATIYGGGKKRNLGRFSTAKDAAICLAKYQAEGAAAAETFRMTFEKPEKAQEAERRLRTAIRKRNLTTERNGVALHIEPNNASGYKGVMCITMKNGQTMYRVEFERDGQKIRSEYMKTAVEAASEYARLRGPATPIGA